MLAMHGHAVTALARAARRGSQADARVAWLRRDLGAMQRSRAIGRCLPDFDVVVNCAGALQDGARDDVAAVQQAAMLALYEAAAAAETRLIVQISARVDGAGSPTEPSWRASAAPTKRWRQSGVPFVILRPAVVIGRNAHGGSALLRGLAAIPWRTPLVHGETPMQFAALDDVARSGPRRGRRTHCAGQRSRARRAETLTLARSRRAAPGVARLAAGTDRSQSPSLRRAVVVAWPPICSAISAGARRCARRPWRSPPAASPTARPPAARPSGERLKIAATKRWPASPPASRISGLPGSIS